MSTLRICPRCGKEKENDAFRPYHSYCYKCILQEHKEYYKYHHEERLIAAKVYREKNREILRVRAHQLAQKKKGLALDALGKHVCEKCGYSKSVAALDIHHTDSTIKDEEMHCKRMREIIEYCLKYKDKLQVLCANCHRETHSSF